MKFGVSGLLSLPDSGMFRGYSLPFLCTGLVNIVRCRWHTCYCTVSPPRHPPPHILYHQNVSYTTLTVPGGTCLRGLPRLSGRSPPGWLSRRRRCHLQPPARRSPSPTPTSSRIPQRCSAPWNASCPTDFPFKKHATPAFFYYFFSSFHEILHHSAHNLVILVCRVPGSHCPQRSF